MTKDRGEVKNIVPEATKNEINAKTNEPTINESTYKMLQYFQDEWKYRHVHIWNILKIFFVVNIAVTLFPFFTGIIDLETKAFYIPSIIFPIAGLVIAIFTFIILNSEVKRLQAVDIAKYRIANMLPEEYRYHNYVTNNYMMTSTENSWEGKKETHFQGICKKCQKEIKQISSNLAYGNFLVQIVLVIISFCLIVFSGVPSLSSLI